VLTCIFSVTFEEPYKAATITNLGGLGLKATSFIDIDGSLGSGMLMIVKFKNKWSVPTKNTCKGFTNQTTMPPYGSQHEKLFKMDFAHYVGLRSCFENRTRREMFSRNTA
jgi:hypothetical protein